MWSSIHLDIEYTPQNPTNVWLKVICCLKTDLQVCPLFRSGLVPFLLLVFRIHNFCIHFNFSEADI